MGQRHQAYVIARVRAKGASKATYRCIAAWHHQWSFGRLPAKAVRRFTELVKVEENAEVIREELRAIDGRYGAHTRKKPVMKAHPCPLTLFLLGTTFNADIEHEVYASGYELTNSALGAYMNPSEGDNNDGITVFDVTDPTKPSYCHSTSTSGPPISALEYARSYTDAPELDEGLQAYLATLNLIPPSALFEAWPDHFEHPPDDCSSEYSAQPNPHPDASLPSLSNLALKPAIEQAIIDEDTEVLERFIWDTEKASSILSVLRDKDSFEPAAIDLLSKLIATNLKAVNLSEFSLSTEQIVEVLSGMKDPIQYLNLSHNSQVTKTTLRVVLEAHPHIRRLVIYGTSISNEDIATLLNEERSLFYHVEQLIHPALFSFQQMKQMTPAFSTWVAPVSYYFNALSLPYINLSTILQSLRDLFKAWIALLDSGEYLGEDMGVSQTSMMALFSGAPREAGRRWGQRAVLCCPLPSVQIFRKGWVFVFNLTFMQFTSPSYGFVRPKTDSENADKPQFEIHDLDSFIAEVLKDGYPAPPSHDVEEVAGLLEKLKEMVISSSKDAEHTGILVGGDSGLTLLTEEGLARSMRRSLR